MPDVVTGIGVVHGVPWMFIANDATVKGGALIPEAIKKAREMGMVTMFECGMRLVEQGVTTREEVLRVTNEDVVDDLETQVRRMLDFCGLPFEESCLEFHRTERNIRTPSSEQVRQPINRSGLDYWRNYEPWLGPLKEALGEDIRRRFAIV